MVKSGCQGIVIEAYGLGGMNYIRRNLVHTERIHCTTSGFDDIDVMPYGVNKAQGARSLPLIQM